MSDLMDKIGALLAKAEATDNEHEQEAYLSKAQQLATLASVDLEAARMRQKNKEKREEPTTKLIRLFDTYDKSKTKSYFIWLIVEIGRTQDLQFTLSWNSTYVTAYGYPSDIEVTEALYNSLAVQMVQSAEAWLKTGEYKNETKNYWDASSFSYIRKPVHGQTARRSFYEGFRTRVANRLHEAKKEALAAMPSVQVSDEGATSSGELVLVNKKEAVQDFYKQNNNARGTYRGAAGGGSSSGRSAGNDAGGRARMGGGASVAGKRVLSVR
jgi:hypothetical protein